ncbi:hypothetical protein JOB18_004626 [Solea senegalensis]|uniref:Protein Jade-2 n=1 Tax=Solea senegalensis TaxID=28829 RepID=A0AAV6PAG3_SOLSE|nr:hypothetical protein JOB18_004626 [Solea senegalensis]
MCVDFNETLNCAVSAPEADRATKMESEKKRRKYSTSSNDSDTTDSQVTSWSRSSKNMGTSSTWVRHQHKKPSEVFRTDFITAMKLPDSAQLGTDDFYVLSDPWRQEWEKGVQVPANLEAIPEPVVRLLPESTRGLPDDGRETNGGPRTPPARVYSCYDLDDLDVAWLEMANQEFRQMALPELDELMMECVLVALESVCEEKMQQAIETEEGLGIEYDEDVVCDVCRSPEGEDGNDGVLRQVQRLRSSGLLWHPEGTTGKLAVSDLCPRCSAQMSALPQERRSPEAHTQWNQVGPRQLCLMDPGGEHRLPREDGTHNQGVPHPCQPLGLVLQPVSRTHWNLHTVLHALLHRGLPCDVRLRPRPGDEDHPGRERRERAERDQLEREKVSQRKQKLQELEDEFYRLVDPREVAENLGLPDSQVDFLYQFWKLKRKANFNQPLVTLKRDEVDNLAQQEQDVLYRRLKLFTHLRQDLERVRNLCYMVTRREKMKHTLCDLQEKIFHLQIQLLEEDMAGAEKSQKGEKRKQNGGVKEKGKERRKSSPEKKKERWKSENGSLLKELGLSKSFPLDNSLFDSWLAQSVQITADDMLSQWALGAQHGEKSGSLLSDQLLQGEESLLNLMMENSMQSTWKTPQLGRKRASNKPRARGQSTAPAHAQTLLSAVANSSASSPSTAKNLWATVVEEKPSYVGRRGERSKGSSKALHHHHLHHHQTRSTDLLGDSPPQPPISKMDSCHISEDRDAWESVAAGNGVPSAAGSVFTTRSSPPPASSPGVTAPNGGGPRLRLLRQVKSRERSINEGVESLQSRELPLTGKDMSLLDTAETDGYFSDGEHSDLDTHSGGRKLRLPQLHSGSEDLLRRSVLAS